MKDQFELYFKEMATTAEEHELIHGISADAPKGMEKTLPFAFLIKDKENHQVLAGITGTSVYGSLYINLLWVAEEYRKKGWGTQLMHEADKLAKRRNCSFLTIHTMDWQAMPFYEKMGYELEYTREGYLNNSKMHFLRKTL